tara:strand:+ start:255 stop:677 length:423 start_codon:yes stop_codon:yes gene_type:complete
MKKKWLGFIVFIIIFILLFIFKESLYLKEKVYVVYKEDKQFYKKKYEDIYYYRKNGQVLKLASFENKSVIQEKYQKIKNINIITIDSLSEILPLNFYKTHLLDKEKLARLKKLRIYIVEVDSIKKFLNIKEVYQSFVEYD